MTPSDEDIDPAKIDPMASPSPSVDADGYGTPMTAPAGGDPSQLEPMAYPNPPVDKDDATEETNASSAEQSDQADDESDDSFPASDPPGNY
jgi:hypothetical protein